MSNLERKVFSSRTSRNASASSSKAGTRSTSKNRTEDSEDFEVSFDIFTGESLVEVLKKKMMESHQNGSDLVLTMKGDIPSQFFQILETLKEPRTNVSTTQRERLLAYLLEIITNSPSKIIDEITEDHLQDIISIFSNCKTETELLLMIKASAALAAATTESVGSIIEPELIPIYSSLLQDSSNTIEVRYNSVMAISTLIMVLYGKTFYKAEEYISNYLEIAENLFMEETPDSKVILALLHGAGLFLTMIKKGKSKNTIIENEVPRFIAMLESPQIDISQAAGRVIALCYESYDFENILYDEFDEPNEEFEESPYYDYDELYYIIENLSKVSSKRLSKKDKQSTHSVFREVLETLENSSDVEKRIEFIEYPSRRKTFVHFKLSPSRSYPIKSWNLYLRLNHLKWCFGNGLKFFLINHSIAELLEEEIDQPDKVIEAPDAEDDINILLDPQSKSEYKKKYLEKKNASRRERSDKIRNDRLDKLQVQIGDLNVH